MYVCNRSKALHRFDNATGNVLDDDNRHVCRPPHTAAQLRHSGPGQLNYTNVATASFLVFVSFLFQHSSVLTSVPPCRLLDTNAIHSSTTSPPFLLFIWRSLFSHCDYCLMEYIAGSTRLKREQFNFLTQDLKIFFTGHLCSPYRKSVQKNV
jgi:hypothetical protein